MPKKTSATPATLALERAQIVFVTHSYTHDPTSSSYGLEAAQALGRDPSQVFKTLVVADVGHPRNLAVGIVPVSTTLNLKAMAAALGIKRVAMASIPDAERATGYVAGGISPIGQRQRLPLILDESACAFATILVSGGRRGLEVELAPADLQAVNGATTAPIATADKCEELWEKPLSPLRCEDG